MKDEEIIRLFLERSENALKEAERTYKNYCKYNALNILGNDEDAEECTNDALTAVWNSIPPQRPSNLKTYMGKLVREISISRWRKNHAAKRAPSEYQMSLDEIDEIASDGDVASSIDAQILGEEISGFLRSLPREPRDMFIRRYWFSDSIEAICKRYGFSQSKVKVSLKRTRDHLAKYLKEKGYITPSSSYRKTPMFLKQNNNRALSL